MLIHNLTSMDGGHELRMDVKSAVLNFFSYFPKVSNF